MQKQGNASTANTNTIAEELESWEGDSELATIPGEATPELSGVQNNLEWAEQIKLRVNAEFDRVAVAIHASAERRNEERRMETLVLMSILESKRTEVMSRQDAGYFIHDWQQIVHQVSTMIRSDARYLAMRKKRRAQGGRLRHLDELESVGKS